MGWFQTLSAEFAITVTDGAVWLSIGQGLLVGAVCLVFGIWVARFVGFLGPEAPAGDAVGVGLATGLLVLASWWAAIASDGRSSFTPVAVGFVIALGLTVVRRWRRVADGDNVGTNAPPIATESASPTSARRWNGAVAVLGGAAFCVAVALLYGSTLVLSVRDGVQPLEFNDEAYYSVLGADLARTGTESIFSPSGFDQVAGLPVQSWYHWGELWLGSAVATIFGMEPLHARHFVVLPLLLLAAAALTGALVRRMTKSTSRAAFLFGFLACLFLAPVPLNQGPLLGALSVGLIFGITAYGLAAVAVLLVLYGLTVLDRQASTWALAAFVGTATALIVPAHIVVALLGLVGVGAVWTIRIGQSLLATRHWPAVPYAWRETFVAAGTAVVATAAWGLLTGHSVGSSVASPNVSSFNVFWRDAVAISILGAGAFLAIFIAWFMVRREASIEADLYLGTVVLLVMGALAWGARLGDLFASHLLVAGIAIFAAPAAAVAVWSIWRRVRATGHTRLAVAALVLCSAQMEFGVAMGIVRLQSFGPQGYEPVPVDILSEIRTLPPGAKLAYACRPSEEVAFWEARLLSLDAHTGRRFIPMCFQAEVMASLTGTSVSSETPGPLFQWAPQSALFPDPGAHPSASDVTAFMKANAIDYIYADALHPNSLVPDAIPIATSGETQVLRLP